MIMHNFMKTGKLFLTKRHGTVNKYQMLDEFCLSLNCVKSLLIHFKYCSSFEMHIVYFIEYVLI
jgi:hypothetical protein